MVSSNDVSSTMRSATPWGSKRPAVNTTTSYDTLLIERLQAGDEIAFANLLERLYPSMLCFARSILANHETAEDVVQDAWLAALRGLERFEGRSSLKSWLFSIVFNKACTRRRARLHSFSR